ncbi:MAG: hypothetical protein WC819_01920 [Parcubacteria group bacterium]|jgi:hypothetical protein
MKTTSKNFRLLFAFLFAMTITFTSSATMATEDEDDVADDAVVSSQDVGAVPTSTEDAEEETAPQPTDAQASDEQEEATGLSVSGDVTVATMNVDALSGEKLSSHITIAPTVIVSYDDFYASATLTTEDFDKRFSDNTANSVQISVGMEKEFAGITFDGGMGFLDTQNSAGDFWCIYLNAEMKELAIIPYIKVEVDIPTNKEITEGGFLYRFGGKYAWNEILFDLSVAGHDGAYGYKPQALSSGLLSVSREFTLWGQKIIPSVNIQKTFDTDGIAEDLVWLNLQVKF